MSEHSVVMAMAQLTVRYHSSGNFRVKNNSCEKFSCC